MTSLTNSAACLRILRHPNSPSHDLLGGHASHGSSPMEKLAGRDFEDGEEGCQRPETIGVNRGCILGILIGGLGTTVLLC